MDVNATNKMQFCCWLFFLLCLQFNNSTLLSFNEGDDAEMIFQYYDLDNAEVTLHVSKRPMFYHSGNISMGGLTQKQRGRFSVQEGQHTTKLTHKTINDIKVKIRNVTREDAGTFICEIYKNGEKQDELTKKIGLQVEFPPGKATCEIEGSFGEMKGVWVRVHCTAPVGSIQGYIDCYQQGEKMPSRTRPVQNRETLRQTIWIKRAIHAYCCTSNYEKPTERCNCKDFGWDPTAGIIPEDKIDPCQITQTESHRELRLKTPGNPSSISNRLLIDASTTPVSETEDHKSKYSLDSGTLKVIAICVLLIVIAILVTKHITLQKTMKSNESQCKRNRKESECCGDESGKPKTNTETTSDANDSKQSEDNGATSREDDKKIETKAYAIEFESGSAAQAKTVRSKFTTNRAQKKLKEVTNTTV